jgi:hypothetical protein
MRSILNEDHVKDLFSSNWNNYAVLIALYRQALSNWDEIEYIVEGRPHIGEKGWHAIYDLFVAFDKKHHGREDVVPGAIWLGQGFAMDERLGDWEIDTAELKLILKPA